MSPAMANDDECARLRSEVARLTTERDKIAAEKDHIKTAYTKLSKRHMLVKKKNNFLLEQYKSLAGRMAQLTNDRKFTGKARTIVKDIIIAANTKLKKAMDECDEEQRQLIAEDGNLRADTERVKENEFKYVTNKVMFELGKLEVGSASAGQGEGEGIEENEDEMQYAYV